ncbi:winged helix-turn-helix domain-containing protein [Sphingomonas sp. LY160]|uniref:winged helix-turn-helix domain-containing protein n=1 Tax=Sphingomonas sp. LY160 TaxID=3095342 RepID=UPI002ADEAE4C|nr:winged helix-turn-helix domain-containing protein [Sphingomonas sp. LY160]MEA1072976.1 winged helix-turn-helix domain-containing protein [Sphingomonas sp. LY160]
MSFLTTAELASRPDFRLGQARVSPSKRSMTGPGGTALVEPRVMQVLTVLAEARGKVVTRDTLFRRCWGNSCVGDDSLNRAIASARRLAQGAAANSFAIENIPRTGYCLTEMQSAEGDTPAASEATRPAMSRRWVVAGGLSVAAIGGAGVWTQVRPASPVKRLVEDSQVAMRVGTPAGERRAIALLEKAVALSPNDAQVWGLLALTRARADEHAGPTFVAPATAVDQAATRALQLDPDNADALAARAAAVPYYGDWLAAERRFDEVLKRHPDHLFTRDSRSFMLGAVGRMHESATARLAFESAGLFDANLQMRRVYALWFLGRINEGSSVAARAMEMWPTNVGIWFARFWLLSGSGRLDRALIHVEDAAGRPPLPPPMVATLRAATRAAISRRPAEIEAAGNMLMAGVAQSVASVVNAMMLLNLIGATDRAFDLARAYYLEQGPIVAAMNWRRGPAIPDQRRRKTNMLFTPTAAAMQRDDRFMPLMSEMGLVDYWRRGGKYPDFWPVDRT